MMFLRLWRKSKFQVRLLHTHSRLSRDGRSFTRKINPDDELLIVDESEGQPLDHYENVHGFEGRPPMTRKYRSQEEAHEEFVKRKIIERKERKLYKPSRHLGLLTWAARMQIQHLNKKDPIYWTPQMLASSFPVSASQVTQILRAKWLPKDDQAIAEYDKKTYRNWLRLKKALNNVDGKAENEVNEEDRHLVEENKEVLHLLPYAAGNSTFSLPPTSMVFRTQAQVVEENKPVVKPFFSSILTSYDEDKVRMKADKNQTEKPIGYGEALVGMLLEGIANPKIKEVSLRDIEKRFDFVMDDKSDFDVQEQQVSTGIKNSRYHERNSLGRTDFRGHNHDLEEENACEGESLRHQNRKWPVRDQFNESQKETDFVRKDFSRPCEVGSQKETLKHKNLSLNDHEESAFVRKDFRPVHGTWPEEYDFEKRSLRKMHKEWQQETPYKDNHFKHQDEVWQEETPYKDNHFKHQGEVWQEENVTVKKMFSDENEGWSKKNDFKHGYSSHRNRKSQKNFTYTEKEFWQPYEELLEEIGLEGSLHDIDMLYDIEEDPNGHKNMDGNDTRPKQRLRNSKSKHDDIPEEY